MSESAEDKHSRQNVPVVMISCQALKTLWTKTQMSPPSFLSGGLVGLSVAGRFQSRFSAQLKSLLEADEGLDFLFFSGDSVRVKSV